MNYISNVDRLDKFNQIKSVLDNYAKLSECRVLDIGTGSGHIAAYFSMICKEVVSIDVVDERELKDGYTFIKVDDELIPSLPGYFDVVISNHTVEHLKNHKTHFEEIFRVLKPGGVCYMAFPNNIYPIEPHTKLPLIHYLVSPKGVNHLSKPEFVFYSQLFERVIDITPGLIRKRSKLLSLFRFISPTNVYVLKKGGA